MIKGYLFQEGIDVRGGKIRTALQTVDSEGVNQRKTKVIKRRLYYARAGNTVWYININEKLSPWGFYIYEGLDGHLCKILWELFLLINYLSRYWKFIVMLQIHLEDQNL